MCTISLLFLSGECGNLLSRALVTELVGIEHVALGSDFDGDKLPFDVTGMSLITNSLLEAGFTPEEIALIMGENTLRVLRKSLRSY